MQHEQIPVELLEVKDKVLVFRGDEFGHQFLDMIKTNLKKKGAEPLAVILLPDFHYMASADKEETIQALKDVIKQLEER